MTLVEGRTYRIAFAEPRTGTVVVQRANYLGRAEGLLVDETNAFRFDDHDHVCVLISDGLLIHADEIDVMQEAKEKEHRANGAPSQPAATAG